MTEEEVRKLAQAIAIANGHSHPGEWSEKVVKLYGEYQDVPTEPDPIPMTKYNSLKRSGK